MTSLVFLTKKCAHSLSVFTFGTTGTTWSNFRKIESSSHSTSSGGGEAHQSVTSKNKLPLNVYYWHLMLLRGLK